MTSNQVVALARVMKASANSVFLLGFLFNIGFYASMGQVEEASKVESFVVCLVTGAIIGWMWAGVRKRIVAFEKLAEESVQS